MTTRIQQDRVRIALVTVAYVVIGWLGYRLLDLGARPSPIWMSAGIALAGVYLWGNRVVLGVFAGDFLLSVVLGKNIEVAVFSAVGSALAALFGAKLLRYGKFSPALGRIHDVILLVFLGALLPAMVNASIDVLGRAWMSQWTWRTFGQYWAIIWLGDVTGVLMITPILLRSLYHRRHFWKDQEPHRFLEAFFCMSLLFVVGWVVLGAKGSSDRLDQWSVVGYLEYLPFPFVAWAALRFQTWGAVSANFAISALALIGLARKAGPFILQTPDVTRAAIVLQIFLAIVMATSLFLSAAIVDRQRIDRALTETLEREHLLTQVALRVHQSLDLDHVLHTIVEEIRDFLNVEQVYIGHCQEDGARVVAESRGSGIFSLMGWVPEPELLGELGQLFKRSNAIIADNTAKVQTLPYLMGYYEHLGVQSSLVLPLSANNEQLGALVLHQYSAPRHWQKGEVKLLEQLATQVSIAIYQARLYRQVRALNNNLERQVEERTLEIRQKVKENERLYEMKTVFLQAVAHDLRTSLMGLVMLLKNLQHRSGDCITLSKPILDRLVQSGDRQLTLIDALAENHFAEQRPLQLNRQTFSLSERVDTWIEDWRSECQRSGAKLINLIPEDLPPISADANHIYQVFRNLIENALKHNPPGLQLAIDARLDRDWIYCSVSDNGVGMDEEQCQHLFGLYVRNLHNQHLTGIGLGSYQCRQIIEAHGGTIGVKSTPDVGSRIWFTLPIASVAAGVNA
ncbi:MASE1 domain-containing protein [Pannus brasiliensis CCIBt3594]|uniref:histidine kinase n=1 Tax=Pannus brasiliensis CCIBt3594 TaxID=1427578 RepID=A0AAW9QNC5_9CHRO